MYSQQFKTAQALRERQLRDLMTATQIKLYLMLQAAEQVRWYERVLRRVLGWLTIRR